MLYQLAIEWHEYCCHNMDSRSADFIYKGFAATSQMYAACVPCGDVSDLPVIYVLILHHRSAVFCVYDFVVYGITYLFIFLSNIRTVIRIEQ